MNLIYESLLCTILNMSVLSFTFYTLLSRKKKKKGTKAIIKLDISLFKSSGLIDLDKKEGRILSSGNDKPQKLDKKKKNKRQIKNFR